MIRSFLKKYNNWCYINKYFSKNFIAHRFWFFKIIVLSLVKNNTRKQIYDKYHQFVKKFKRHGYTIDSGNLLDRDISWFISVYFNNNLVTIEKGIYSLNKIGEKELNSVRNKFDKRILSMIDSVLEEINEER